MNALIQLPPPGTDSAEWRRELIRTQLQMMQRQQQRSRFVGQLVFVAVLVTFGALLCWALPALGIVRPFDPAALDKVSIAVITVSVALLLGSVVILWDVRLRLTLTEMKMLQRELEPGPDRTGK